MNKFMLATVTSAVLLCLTQTSRAAGPVPADLAAQAKITREQASATALAKVPKGVVKSAELEKEHGRLVWSFDIARPSTPGVTEIQVDAVSGKIVSMEHESANKEAKEAKAEKGEGRPH